MNAFNWEKEVELKWNNQAEFWNERSHDMWENGSRKEVIPFVQSYVRNESKVLDVGCGDGHGSLKLARAGYNVVGVDISGKMISLAKDQVNHERTTFIQGDVNNLPFENDQFDGVMAINVLEWTADPAKALDELIRVVNVDGLLIVGILGPTAGPRTNSYQRLHGENTICNTMMPWEFQKLASDKKLEYMDGYGVYKQGVMEIQYRTLSLELKQALSFLWVFMLRKVA